jgi:hypothetical protein
MAADIFVQVPKNSAKTLVNFLNECATYCVVPTAFSAPADTKAPATKPAVDNVPVKKVVSVAVAKQMVAEHKKLEKFGTQAEKAKVIYAFRNGDKHHAGVKITIHSTKFKTFDQVFIMKGYPLTYQLKQLMSKEVALTTGPVLSVYTVEGKAVKDLNSFVDGDKYVCTGAEKFNKELRMSTMNIKYLFLHSSICNYRQATRRSQSRGT